MITPIQVQAMIIGTHHGQFSRLKYAPLNHISFDQGFWESILRINQTSTLKTQYLHLVTTRRLDNFQRVYGEIDMPYQGYVFKESGVYKRLEAAL
jgi:hypothetical protein